MADFKSHIRPAKQAAALDGASTNIILKHTFEIQDADEDGIYHIPSPIRIHITLCGWSSADYKTHSANDEATKVNCPDCIKAWQYCRQLIVP